MPEDEYTNIQIQNPEPITLTATDLNTEYKKSDFIDDSYELDIGENRITPLIKQTNKTNLDKTIETLKELSSLEDYPQLITLLSIEALEDPLEDKYRKVITNFLNEYAIQSDKMTTATKALATSHLEEEILHHIEKRRI